ncbi:MAG: DNA-directed RNA polymerase subunit alpha [Candidatus Paceibacterota bacterium]|nr:MAG: DNA-directed RNA polymerase subunit alpha [Candidatus Paceibacterota bacterium]
MIYHDIVLPSKPKIISEDGTSGIYEIDGLYPGYGHTLGNSLRRIILSSLPGAAITSVKISGAEHEFSTLKGVKEDVITIILNLKKIRIKFLAEGAQTMHLKVKKEGEVRAGDIEVPGQLEIMNTDLVIAHLTDKNTTLDIEMNVESGLGYVPKEVLQKDKVDIGTIALDAIFTPIRRVSYEVENMRVGDRTDFNRLRVSIETDGSVTPKAALEKSIEIMINQLKAVVGFQEERIMTAEEKQEKSPDEDILKTKIDSLDISTRTLNALSAANIKTIGGLSKKKDKDLLEIEGLGPKGVEEIKKILAEHGLTLKRG